MLSALGRGGGGVRKEVLMGGLLLGPEETAVFRKMSRKKDAAMG